jgi:hypothetical protein
MTTTTLFRTTRGRTLVILAEHHLPEYRLVGLHPRRRLQLDCLRPLLHCTAVDRPPLPHQKSILRKMMFCKKHRTPGPRPLRCKWWKPRRMLRTQLQNIHVDVFSLTAFVLFSTVLQSIVLLFLTSVRPLVPRPLRCKWWKPRRMLRTQLQNNRNTD